MRPRSIVAYNCVLASAVALLASSMTFPWCACESSRWRCHIADLAPRPSPTVALAAPHGQEAAPSEVGLVSVAAWEASTPQRLAQQPPAWSRASAFGNRGVRIGYFPVNLAFFDGEYLVNIV